jgi:hypothetical protein
MLITISSIIVVNRGDYCKNDYHWRKVASNLQFGVGSELEWGNFFVTEWFICTLGASMDWALSFVSWSNGMLFWLFKLVRETLKSKWRRVTRDSLIDPGLDCLLNLHIWTFEPVHFLELSSRKGLTFIFWSVISFHLIDILEYVI